MNNNNNKLGDDSHICPNQLPAMIDNILSSSITTNHSHWGIFAEYLNIGLHWNGLGLDWNGLGWIELDWIELDWIGLD